MDTLKILSELIETTSLAARYLIESEICINDGDLQQSQSLNKKVAELLNTLEKDTFIETKEELFIKEEIPNDYDMPTTLELAKSLVDLSYNAGSYLGILNEDNSDALKKIVSSKIGKSISTVVEIYNAIYNN